MSIHMERREAQVPIWVAWASIYFVPFPSQVSRARVFTKFNLVKERVMEEASQDGTGPPQTDTVVKEVAKVCQTASLLRQQPVPLFLNLRTNLQWWKMNSKNPEVIVTILNGVPSMALSCFAYNIKKNPQGIKPVV